ncbi:glutaredoxin family protein [Halanaerobium congolense]|jgi:glutaredoxin|uniref:Glutaredoxin n=1 Tax=Halanaerobium congolense TaxID=54121 RepID=A0A1G6R3G3_9FIRM|nr:glutaredoxin [Halanaerobium congolense]PXV64008.1 glutaredoxin [Halanaerobium congolense]TDS26172.1 glutaredoxin [Halanaerobium congolense]SDC99061.1 Glutaredoxin [Halanaerobium congolense]SDH42688.1 Glutaredoxin [Halanaerobium congolense]SHM87329.1 Glutaredoxin [Halanaerobium congolense]
MFDLVLYYYPTCPYCRKVTKFIDKHDLEEIELKNINQDEEAEAELIEVGGKRQVPCLFINGKPLYESNDIINWFKSNLI